MQDPFIHLTVDIVLFGYAKEPAISVLLIKRGSDPYKGEWALPGGFVEKGESLEEAVIRELKEETAIRAECIEQLYAFGKPDRDPRGRSVSIAYYGFVKRAGANAKAASDAEDVAWFDMNDLPRLAFDHYDILQKAIERLKSKGPDLPEVFRALEY